MFIFWILAAAMIAVALWFIVPPFLRKDTLPEHTRDEANVAIYKERLQELQNDLDNGALDPEQFEQAKQELQQTLAEDLAPLSAKAESTVSSRGRWGAVAASIMIGVVAVPLYLQLGTLPLTDRPTPVVQGDDPEQLRQINQMVAGLAQRLEEDPDNPEGWAMLGRSYMVLERYAEASRAYARAHQLIGDEPWLLLSYAEAEAHAQQGNMTGRPAELIEKALKQDPDNQKALWLAGIAAAQQGNRSLAEARFGRLLDLLPKDEQVARQVRTVMTQLGLDSSTAVAVEDSPDAQDDSRAAPPPPASLNVQVRLATELRDQVQPTDTVFIFARAPTGPRMPLAVLRKQVKDLPLTVVLDDSLAMIPELKLSQFPRILVVAQVSKSGTASIQSGDLRGASLPVSLNGGQDITVTIDEVVR